MVDKVLKYLNIVLLTGSVIAMTYGAISWFPSTFLTRATADELVQDLNESGLQRDKDLHRQITLNYLETQSKLNIILIEEMQQRKKTEGLTTEDEIELQALISGQADIMKQRNDLVKVRPEWID